MVIYQEDDNTHPRFDKRVAAVSEGFLLGWNIGKRLTGTEQEKAAGRADAEKVRKAIRLMRDGKQRETSVLSMSLLNP